MILFEDLMILSWIQLSLTKISLLKSDKLAVFKLPHVHKKIFADKIDFQNCAQDINYFQMIEKNPVINNYFKTEICLIEKKTNRALFPPFFESLNSISRQLI